jgi:hypothetical protein
MSQNYLQASTKLSLLDVNYESPSRELDKINGALVAASKRVIDFNESAQEPEFKKKNPALERIMVQRIRG